MNSFVCVPSPCCETPCIGRHTVIKWCLRIGLEIMYASWHMRQRTCEVPVPHAKLTPCFIIRLEHGYAIYEPLPNGVALPTRISWSFFAFEVRYSTFAQELLE